MAKENDSLGDRMKGYEGVSRNFLTRRVPAIIRLDGKAFHTFTKGMKKPFDSVLTQTMQETMKYLCGISRAVCLDILSPMRSLWC